MIDSAFYQLSNSRSMHLVIVWLLVFVNSVLVYCGMSLSDSDSDSEPPQGKKEYVFTNKKDAVDAFKSLLKDKVSSYVIWILYITVVHCLHWVHLTIHVRRL